MMESTWSHRRIAGRLADLAVSASQTGRILAGVDIKPYLSVGDHVITRSPTTGPRLADPQRRPRLRQPGR
jgi:hypothetical protein